ncbi:MAG: hypothetical protein IPH10_13980 [bacterium]|nr:hypothetical protein [bacterium]
MPFIDLPTVRKHLVAANIPALKIENTRVTITSLGPVPLEHANLVANSEAVRLLASDVPYLESALVVSNEEPVGLAFKQIVPGTVVIAADRALTTVFTEETDYQVDHTAGSITRRASGAIPNFSPVYVWYSYYTQFEITTDYTLDFAAGTIRRVAGGAIPEGANVYVDYFVSQGSAEDVLIDQAIIEVQDIIVRGLRPGYSASSTDQGLKTGACYLTLAHVARCMSALVLTRSTGTDANSRAREWMTLAEKWEAQAWNILAPFVTPHLMRSSVVE